MVAWKGVVLPKVSVHYAICATVVVYWSSMDLWSIGGGSMASVCHKTDLVWWSSMDLWSIGGGSSASRSAKFGVVVFKASLLGGGSICHRSMLHHYTSPAN